MKRRGFIGRLIAAATGVAVAPKVLAENPTDERIHSTDHESDDIHFDGICDDLTLPEMDKITFNFKFYGEGEEWQFYVLEKVDREFVHYCNDIRMIEYVHVVDGTFHLGSRKGMTGEWFKGQICNLQGFMNNELVLSQPMSELEFVHPIVRWKKWE